MFLAIASRPLPLIKFLKLTTNAGNWLCIEQPANCWHEMYKYHYVAKQVRNRVNVMPAIGCITLITYKIYSAGLIIYIILC